MSPQKGTNSILIFKSIGSLNVLTFMLHDCVKYSVI
jgi:hypothetical protein